MYPFTTPNSLVRNRWYIAAFCSEIGREPIERRLLGLPVALYRRQSGEPVAMYGLCPHRYYPLAKGKVQGDSLVCGYHGFVFEADGKCSKVPSQGTAAGFCQPTYPIVERGPLCWIWMGDPQLQDPANIPPYEDFGLDQPGWHYSSPSYFHLNGRYQLLVDNLMDLTHLPYIHHHVDGGDSMKAPEIREEKRARSLRIVRSGKVPFSQFHEAVFGPDARFEGLSDFETLCDFYGPEFIRTSLPITRSLDSGAPIHPDLGTLSILHGITPETENSTHYFGFATRNFRLAHEDLDRAWVEADSRIRQQDVDAINAVELRLDEGIKRQRELLVRSDGPAVKVRREIQHLLNQES